MANKITFEIIAKALGFKNADQAVKGLSGRMKKFATGLAATGVAYKAIGATIEGVKLAGKLEGVEQAFNNMRDAAGFTINTFSKLDKALNGTADRITVMEQANSAMLLGIVDSDDQMAQMFDTAQRLARAVGQDATYGIESLVTGLGRQSKLMLDNLGIMVDVAKANKEYAEELGKTASELTETERKQAFINKALAEGQRLADGLGEEFLTTSDKIAQFNTSYTNLSIALGEAVVDAGILSWMDTLSTSITGLLEIRRNELAINERAKTKYGDNSEAINQLNTQIDNQIEKHEKLRTTITTVTSVTGSMGEQIDLYKEKARDGTAMTADEIIQFTLLKASIADLKEKRQVLIDGYDTENTVKQTTIDKIKEEIQANKDLAAQQEKNAESLTNFSDWKKANVGSDLELELRAITEKETASLASIDGLIDGEAKKQEILDHYDKLRQEQRDAEAEHTKDLYDDFVEEHFTSETERLEAERTAMLENVKEYEDAEAHKAKIDAFYDKKKKALIKMQKAANAEAIGSAMGSFAALNDAMGGSAELSKGLTIAQAIADAYASYNRAIATGTPPASTIMAAASLASGLANVISIEKAYQDAKKTKSAQYGFEGVVSEPTQFTVGEGGAAEFVSVTPMEGVDNAGGGGMTIVVQGNVMTDDFVEGELAEAIADAVRRGTDFGIS